MGIYLPNMEMPEDGVYFCEVGVIDGVGTITFHTKERQVFHLVEVPPHGKLIDADALIEDLERQCKEVFRVDAVSPDDYWIIRDAAYKEALWKSWVESFGDYLKTRPTIIEAEE